MASDELDLGPIAIENGIPVKHVNDINDSENQKMDRRINSRSYLLLWLVSTIECGPVEDSALGRTWISPNGVASQ